MNKILKFKPIACMLLACTMSAASAKTNRNIENQLLNSNPSSHLNLRKMSVMDSIPEDTTELVSHFEHTEIYEPKNTFPSFHHAAVVRYPTSADVLIELNITNYLKNPSYKLICKADDGTQKHRTVSSKMNQVLFTNLKLNQNYTVELETPDTTIVFGKFSTSQNPSDVLSVPDKFFHEIGAFSSLSDAVDPMQLLEHILGLNNISIYQRVSFIQDYYLKDEPLAIRIPSLPNLIPTIIGPITERVRQALQNANANPCNCNLLISSAVSISGGYLNSDPTHTTSSEPSEVTEKTYASDDLQGIKYTKTVQRLGPAKFYKLNMIANNAKKHKVHTESDRELGTETSYSPNWMIMAFNWLCTTNGSQNPSCCEKTIYYEYLYNTNIGATMNTGENNGTFSLAASIQDNAMIIESELTSGSSNPTNSSAIQIVDAGRAFAEVNFDREFNTHYIDTAALSATNIIKAAFSGSDEEIIAAAITEAVRLLKTKRFIHSGVKQDKEEKHTLLSSVNTRSVLLKPGKMRKIAMFSGQQGAVTAKNNKSHEKSATAYTLSDFRFAAHIPATDVLGNQCNNYSNNLFIIGGPNIGYTTPSKKHNHIQQTNDFYHLYQTGHNNGWMWGSESYDANNNPQSKLNIDNTENKDNEVVIENIQTIRVVDLSGRVIFECNEKIQLNEFLNSLESDKIVLINHLFYDGTFKTFKFIK
jgi:hypothetical protein